ncbi:hypothetical protein Lal_00015045 [Lupinus albus]|nr:hypothetical protein Lal_00015045 [Lupinus albus]
MDPWESKGASERVLDAGLHGAARDRAGGVAVAFDLGVADAVEQVVRVQRQLHLRRHLVVQERVHDGVAGQDERAGVVAPAFTRADHGQAEAGRAQVVARRQLVHGVRLAPRRVADGRLAARRRRRDLRVRQREAARDAEVAHAVGRFQLGAFRVVAVRGRQLRRRFVVGLFGAGAEQREERGQAAAAPFHAAFQLLDGVDADRRAAIQRGAEQDAVRVERDAFARAGEQRQRRRHAPVAAHGIRRVADVVVDVLHGARLVCGGIGGDVGAAAGVLAVAAHAGVHVDRALFPAHVRVRRIGAVFDVDGARAAGAERGADKARRAARGLQQRGVVARRLHQILVEVPRQAQLLQGAVPAGRHVQLRAVDLEGFGQARIVQRVARVVDRCVEDDGIERAAVIGLAGGRAGSEGVVAHRAAVGREDADEAAAVVRLAEFVGHGPAVAQVVRAFQSDRVALHREAVVDVARHVAVALGERDVLHPVWRVERRVARVDAGDFRDMAVVDEDRHGQRRRALVVEVLQRHAHVAAVEVVLEVDARAVVVEAAREADAAAFLLAVLADEVDDAAGRVGGEGRRRAAAHDFHVVEGAVDLDVAVGRDEVEVAELQHRQAVFLDLHVARAARGDGHAAHGDVGIAFAARRFRAHAGDRAQHFGGARRGEVLDGVGFQRADRDARLQLARAERRAGDDDALHLQAIGRCGRRGAVLRGCGTQVQQSQRHGTRRVLHANFHVSSVVFGLLAPCQARGHYFAIFGKLQSIAITLQKRLNAHRQHRRSGGTRSGAGADDQFGGKADGGCAATVDEDEQRIDEGARGHVARLADGGERRMEVAGQLDIVVADDGHVARHVAAPLAQGVDGFHRQQVAGREQAVVRNAAPGQFRHGLAAALGQERRGHVQLRIGRQAVRGQRFDVAAVALFDFGQRGVAKEGDAAPALCQQAFRREAAARDVVAADRRVQLLRQLRAPHDERHAARGHLVQLVVVAALADQDHADGAAAVERGGGRVDLVGIHARDEDVEALVAERVREAAQHRQEERVGQLLARGLLDRDDDGHRAVLLQPQVLRADVDRVVQRAREVQDAVARFLVDEGAVAERARDGRRRHAGEACDVGHLQPPGRRGHWPKARQVRVGAAPVDVREAERQPAERAADGDVGQRVMDPHAERLLAQVRGHHGQAAVHLAHLAVEPGLALLVGGAPVAFQVGQHGRVQHAVRQRFPHLDVGAVAAVRGQQLAHGRERVEVFGDDARVVHRAAVFHHEAWHLAQRVRRGDLRFRRPDVFQLELIVELFLCQHDARLAHVGTGEGTDEFHRCSVMWIGRQIPFLHSPLPASHDLYRILLDPVGPVPAGRPLCRQDRQAASDPVGSRLHAPPCESGDRLAAGAVAGRLRRTETVLRRCQRAAGQAGRRLLGRRRRPHQGDRGRHEPRRESRRVLAEGESEGRAGAGGRFRIHPLRVHVGRHQQHVARHDAESRPRRRAAAVAAGGHRQADRNRPRERRPADAVAHARPDRQPDHPRQGIRQRRRPPAARREAHRRRGNPRQDERRRRQLQRAPLGISGLRLAGVLEERHRTAPGPDVQPVHHPDRAARLHGRTVRRGRAHEHDPARPEPRYLDVRLPRLLQAEAEGRRDRFVDDAAQGEPDRLRELGRQPGPGQRRAAPHGGQAAGLAHAARPDRLHRPAQHRRGLGLRAARVRQLPARPEQARSESGPPGAGPGRELGSAGRAGADRDAPLRHREPVRAAEGTHARQGHHARRAAGIHRQAGDSAGCERPAAGDDAGELHGSCGAAGKSHLNLPNAWARGARPTLTQGGRPSAHAPHRSHAGPDHRHFHPLCRAPAEAGVDGPVSRHLRKTQRAVAAHGQFQFAVRADHVAGAQPGRPGRIAARRHEAALVGATGLQREFFVQQRGPRRQAPCLRHLHIAPRLQAARLPFHQVAEHDLSGRCQILRAQVVVQVAERRHRIRHDLPRLAAVTQFEHARGLAPHGPAARQQVRRGAGHVRLHVEPRRRAHGARRGRPERVRRRGTPGQAHVRQEFDPGVRIAFPAHAGRHAQVVAQGHLVLGKQGGPRLVRARGQEGDEAAVVHAVAVVAVFAAPHDAVPAVRRQRVLQLQVDDVDGVRERGRHLAVAVVVIRLRHEAAAAVRHVLPPCRDVGAAEGDVVQARVRAGRRDDAGRRLALAPAPRVGIDAEPLGAPLPVAAPAHLPLRPVVVDGTAGTELAVPQSEHLAVGTPMAAVHRPATAERGLRAVVVRAQHEQVALRRARVARRHVDDAVDGIHAPQGAAGAADHFDPLDVFQQHVRLVPEHAGEQRGIHGAAVDHHEQLVGRAVARAVHAARGDEIVGVAAARDLQVGREVQRLDEIARTRAADVFRRDHEHGRRRILQPLGPARDRRDVDVRQLFDRQVREFVPAHRFLGLR